MAIGLALLACQHGLEHIDNLVLLTPWQPGNRLDDAAQLAARWNGAFWARLAQQLLDGDPKGFGDRNQNIRAGQIAAGLPIVDVGRLFVDLARQFAERKTHLLTQLPESGRSFGHIGSIKEAGKNGLHTFSILNTIVQCNRS